MEEMKFFLGLKKQRDFFLSGKTRSYAFRHDQLSLLERAIEVREEQILRALREDLGKPAHEAYAGEIAFVLREIRHAKKNLTRWMRDRRHSLPWITWPGRAFQRPEPYGVALIIGPWNYPFQLLLLPLVGAIAAGNCVCLKPSELAGATGQVVMDLVRETFPDDYISIVNGGVEVAEDLLRQKFDKIFFTGGTTVGRKVMKAAADHLTPVTLELGGKCPCLVCEDASMEVTAQRIAWGKFMNAGQTCVAPDYVLVEEKCYEHLLREMKQAIKRFYGEEPQKSGDYARIVNARHVERLVRLMAGGRIYLGGEVDRERRYLAPTLLTDVDWNSELMREEIFGPLLPIIPVRDVDVAIDYWRDKPSPLAIYLFTKDVSVQKRVIDSSRSGGVCVNDIMVQLLGKDLPFGGVGESGMGAYHGKSSFEAFSYPRALAERSFAWDSRLKYPPYRIAMKWFKKMMRMS